MGRDRGRDQIEHQNVRLKDKVSVSIDRTGDTIEDVTWDAIGDVTRSKTSGVLCSPHASSSARVILPSVRVVHLGRSTCHAISGRGD